MCCARRGTRRAQATGLACLVAGILLLRPAISAAQDAELQGVVKDQSGAVVPGATVTIVDRNNGAQRAITTDTAGHYVFSLLGPGDYDIGAEGAGFQPVPSHGVRIDSGSRITLDLVLQPAQIRETVAVSATAAVDESPGDATVIDRDFLDNIAIDSRALQSIVLLAPGVVGIGINSSDLEFSVDGNRTTSNVVTIDGVSANIAAPRNQSGPPINSRFGPIA